MIMYFVLLLLIWPILEWFEIGDELTRGHTTNDK